MKLDERIPDRKLYIEALEKQKNKDSKSIQSLFKVYLKPIQSLLKAYSKST